MTIGKLYHYKDSNLNRELTRIYDYIQNAQIESDNLNVPEVATRLVTILPYENLREEIPHLALERSVREQIPDFMAISVDNGTGLTRSVQFKAVFTDPELVDVNNRFPVIFWNSSVAFGNPSSLSAGGSQSVTQGTLIETLSNDALLIVSDDTGLVSVSVTITTTPFSTVFSSSWPTNSASTGLYSWT